MFKYFVLINKHEAIVGLTKAEAMIIKAHLRNAAKQGE